MRRTDGESAVIVVWVVLALSVAVVALLDAIGNGEWLIHLGVLVLAQLVLAGLAKLALRLVAPRR